MKGRDIGSVAGAAGATALGLPPQLGAAVGGIFGGLFDGDDDAAAQAAFSKAMAEIESVGAPPEEAKEILYKNFIQVGIQPEKAEQAVALSSPKVAEIKEAPALREAQMQALQLIGQRAKTGLGAEDRAALAQMQLQQARETEAKRQQIIQSFQQRGLGGGGAELAAQLQAASAGAAQAGEEGLKIQAQAAQSALEAASRMGTLGQQIRGQEFDIAKAKAGALDEAAMARFNEAVSRQQRNVAAERQRLASNLATAQRLSEANIATSQAEALRQRQAQTGDWKRRLEYAKEKAGMYKGQGEREQKRAQQETARSAETATGLTDIIGSTDWGNVKSTVGGWFSKPETGSYSERLAPSKDMKEYIKQYGNPAAELKNPFNKKNPYSK